MAKHDQYVGLTSLPVELRRKIILEVLKSTRQPPTLSAETIKGRARLRNQFDQNYALHTNIYIEQQKIGYINANALLQTNRQLRHDTLALIDDTVKTGLADAPFVLDIMLVKGVGLLPTWLSFPYMPEHISQLQIELRIIRPEKVEIPPDWLSLAQVWDDNEVYRSCPTVWNLYTVFFLYALGCLSSSPRNAAPRKIKLQKIKDNLEMVSDTRHVDAYVCTNAPYTVDNLLIHIHSFEYRANGEAITPYVADPWPPSALVKDRCTPFLRTFF